MPARLSFPSDHELERFLAEQAGESFSYPHVGATQTSRPVPGYDFDQNRCCIGRGHELFERAAAGLASWRMFPPAWTAIRPPLAPAEGVTVAMLARTLGVWWVNACRVVYTIDERHPVRRFGFAYGTLPAHVERGEELFLVEMLADETVWYEIRSFSRPRLALVWAGYPLARTFQRRFVRQSQIAFGRALRS